jgi:hypothetical protein
MSKPCLGILGSNRLQRPPEGGFERRVGAGAIHPPSPGAGFPAQGVEVGDSAVTQALAREEPDFDFRLVEPTAVAGGVVNGEAFPDLTARLPPVAVGQGFAAVDVEVVPPPSEWSWHLGTAWPTQSSPARTRKPNGRGSGR